MSEWEIIEEVKGNASIRVIGVGGGGGNAVQHMVECGIEGAEFISINTDKQALDKNDASTKLILGMEITDGLGAGAREAAERGQGPQAGAWHGGEPQTPNAQR